MWEMLEAWWPWSHYSVTVSNLAKENQRLDQALKESHDKIKTLLDLLDFGSGIMAENKRIIATHEATMQADAIDIATLTAEIEKLRAWQSMIRKKTEISKRLFTLAWQKQRDASMQMGDEMDILYSTIHKDGE